MAWYGDDWGYRIKVTVNSSQVDEGGEVPLYLDLSELPAGFHTNVNQTDARDIRITTADGSTEVPREVVFYDAASDAGEVHFKGTISATNDTDFYLYYGNGTASDYAVDATYGAENVWPSSYGAVYHFQEASGAYVDSTSNDNDTSSVSVTSRTATGSAGYAPDFEKANKDAVQVSSDSSLNPTGAITLQAYIKGESFPSGDYNRIVAKDVSADTQQYQLFIYGGGAGGIGWRIKDGGAWYGGEFDTQPATGVFYLLHGTYDGDTLKLYINGSEEATTYSHSGSVNSGTGDLGIGYKTDIDESRFYFDGIIDEVRILSSALSGNAISTEYNCMSDQSSFYSIGSEESQPTTQLTDFVTQGITSLMGVSKILT